MALLEKPDDNFGDKKRLELAAKPVISKKQLSLNKLLDLRNILRNSGEDYSSVDVELKARFGSP